MSLHRAALIIVSIFVLAFLALLWMTLHEHHRAAEAARRAEASQIVAQGQVAAGRDAVAIVTANAAHGAEIDRQTQENRDAILNAPGAGAQLDPILDAAARHAVCMRASARNDPSCQSVLKPSSE